MTQALRIFAAVFWVTWFAIVAPLHQRGILSDDCGAEHGAVRACCAKPATKDAPALPAKTCAICRTLSVAGIEPPMQAPPLAPQRTKFVATADVPALHAFLSVRHSRCRGPPAA